MVGSVATSGSPATRPTAFESAFNRLVGWLVGLGLMPANFYVLDVPGRKSGRIHSTPVDLLSHGGRTYLVAPRGETQWVRNARASRAVTLRRGRTSERHALRELGDDEKPDVLKAYLDAYKRQVQRFFPIEAGSPVEAFRPLAARYPAFELRKTAG
jgi:deazaflavin-dependent oxidoreductase (nitroreductase family)